MILALDCIEFMRFAKNRHFCLFFLSLKSYSKKHNNIWEILGIMTSNYTINIIRSIYSSII